MIKITKMFWLQYEITVASCFKLIYDGRWRILTETENNKKIFFETSNNCGFYLLNVQFLDGSAQKWHTPIESESNRDLTGVN